MFSLRRDEKSRLVLLAAVLGAHAAVWLLSLVLRPGLEPNRQIVAEIMSTSALVFMSVNLGLATRLPLFERFLCGLDKLFVTHRIIGLAIVFFVGVHFVIVPRSDGFVPTKAVSLPTFFTLLAAIFIATAPRFPWRRLVPLKYHTWKATHRLMGLFVLLAVAHSLLAETYVRQVPFLAIYVYGIAALGLVAWALRELRVPAIRPVYAHTIESFKETGDVAEMRLSPGGPSRQAGQFAMLSLEKGPTFEQHPFTISSGADDPYRFSVKSSGDFTDAVLAQGVALGSVARVEGPYGAFDHRIGKRDQVWIAGGIGITPFLSMATALDDVTQVLLVWSVHNHDEAVYEAELTRLAERRPNLRLMVHVSSLVGHIDVAKLPLSATPRDCSAFVCGPHGMRVTVVRQLRQAGFARSEIYFEEFRLR